MPTRPPLPRLAVLALIAAVDLAVARFALLTITPKDVIARNRKMAMVYRAQLTQDRILEACVEAGFIINRVAARLPWRADCLVQALAGQRWLARAGIASEIIVGAAKADDGTVAAHAWLRAQGEVVLGGNITAYRTLLGSQVSSDQLG